MSISSIGGLLQVFLLGDMTIASTISGDDNRPRLYPVRLPQKAEFPAITYTRISGERIGRLRGPASAAEPRYQVDCWARNWSDALALGSLVRQRLEAFIGNWTDAGSPPSMSVFVQVRFDSERDLFEEDVLGGLCRHSADYFVFHDSLAGAL